jgi:DNA-binding IclR family transcriptional regulator
MAMQSSEKTLEILEEFLNQPAGITVSKLANLRGLSVSTVHRIVSVLKKKGYVNQRSRRGKYFLGSKFFEFCNILRTAMKIEDVAHPFLKKLNRTVGEFVHLTIMKGNKAVDTEQIPASKRLKLQIEFRLGDELPLYCTAVGKIFLAHMTEEELERYFNTTIIESNTKNTITNPSKLKEQLQVIKKEGVAFDHEEFEVGLSAVASPVKGRNGDVVASIGIAGPTARITTRKMRKLAMIVKSCALDISWALGYEGK